MQRRLEVLAEKCGARGFTFDDLAAAAVEVGAGAHDVGEWLAESLESGYLAALGQETLSDGTVIGPTSYCLASALDRKPSGSHVCGNGGDGDRDEDSDATRSAQRYVEPPVVR